MTSRLSWTWSCPRGSWLGERAQIASAWDDAGDDAETGADADAGNDADAGDDADTGADADTGDDRAGDDDSENNDDDDEDSAEFDEPQPTPWRTM